MVSDTGEQLGILPIAQALDLARQKEMDLVEVAAEAVPPVCRIMDFGKYKYTQARRQNEARNKKQTVILVKEASWVPRRTRTTSTSRPSTCGGFIEEATRPRSRCASRREMAHTELGWKMLNRMQELMSDLAVVESHPRMEGRMLSMILSPKAH